MHFLRRECLLGPLLRILVLALDVLALDHIDDVLEPLAKQDSVLSTARLAKIAACKAHFGRFFFDGCLQPHRLFFLSWTDARLGQLVSQVVQRLQQLAPVCASAPSCCTCLTTSRARLFHLVE